MSFCKLVMWNCRMRNCKKVVKNCHKVCDFVKKVCVFVKKVMKICQSLPLKKVCDFVKWYFFLSKSNEL